MINMAIDVAKMTKLQTKFDKYGPYAIKQGLKADNEFLNTPSFLMSMYPPSQSGQPFIWSSDKQRRFVHANIKLPSTRTFGMALSGRFEVNESSFWIEYQNFAPYAKWVINSMFQIIGHKMRGWKPVQTFVKAQSANIVSTFKTAALAAWEEMDAFISGGGAGL